VITLDTHNDIDPRTSPRDCNYTMRLTTQVNLPKMKEGGLDVSFMIVYVGQSNPPQVADASSRRLRPRLQGGVAKFDAVHHLTEEIAPNEIELALTAAEVTRIAKSGKKVAVIGSRTATRSAPTSTASRSSGSAAAATCRSPTTATASSPTRTPAKPTTSGAGAACRRSAGRCFQEMNRWGIMVDVSHPSKGSMMQAIGLLEGAGDRVALVGPKLANTAATWTTRC
jgi:membrane dipeptidase